MALTPQLTAAQDDTVTVYLQPWDATAGTVIPHMCLSLAGASNVGCDDNGDGYIAFQGIQPGTYTVVQETIIAGIVQLGDDVTITVADTPAEQYFTIDFHELGDATPAPTLVPTVAPPDAGTQGSGGASGGSGNATSGSAGDTVTTLPTTGTGVMASTGTFSLMMLALLVGASTAALAASILRWRWRHPHA
ncbi:MAG: hypothetical protein ACTHMX_05390 [Thermomicrobiales bacterium]